MLTNPFKLTDAEFAVARILVQECLGGMGGSRPSDLEFDEYTWADPADLQGYGYSDHQAAGFFSSLSTKGFIADSGDTDESGRAVWYVVTKGWKWMDTEWDSAEA